MKIFKYEINPNDNTVEMPDGAKVLSAGVQSGRIFVWALVNETSPNVLLREFAVFGTGHNIPLFIAEEYTFINTVFIDGLVFHVFRS